jgi:Protein of unknown function (DUF3231).
MENVQPGTGNATEQPVPYNLIKDGPNDERLTAPEMGHLWEMYLYNGSVKCQLQYFTAKAEDPEIRGVLEFALQTKTTRLDKITKIFNTVGFPVPHGFTDEDVEPNAKRLYSDSFMLVYIRNVINFELVESMMGLTRAIRPDVKEYFNASIDESQDLLKRADEVLLRKGVFVKPLNFPLPDRIEYVYQDTFFAGLGGDKRPINTLEVTHVYTRLQTKMLERTLILGFSQAVQSQKVQKLLSQGKQMIDKQIEGWSKILQDEDFPLPVTWEHQITDSSESSFSDKLIIFTVLTMMRNSVILLGISLANCSRLDIVTAFSASIVKLQAYTKDILDLMINSGWLEKIPQTIDRMEIINQKQ